MTKINDSIRQASLFTMNGLIDPRLMPEHSPNQVSANENDNLFTRIQQAAEQFIMKHWMSMKVKH